MPQAQCPHLTHQTTTDNPIVELQQERIPLRNSSHSHASSLPTLSSQASDCCYPSKGTFRQLTREILNLTVQSTERAGIPVSSLDPKKFNPADEMSVPVAYDRYAEDPDHTLTSKKAYQCFSHSSYSSTDDSRGSIGEKNAWEYRLASPVTRVAREPSPSKAYSYPVDSSQYARNLPQSKSEGNVKSLDYGSRDNADMSLYYHEWQSASKANLVQNQPKGEQLRANRARGRSNSPVKVLEDLDEENPIEFDRPRHRSRSPHKKLFGENGWLGTSPNIKESPGERNKRGGLKALGEKIKQRMEDMTGDVIKTASLPFQPKMLSKSTCPISMDPPLQAKLYSEMELMICVTANQFLIGQYQAGRMSAESVTKVTNFWISKGRPQVVQFQFDQATQRDLIIYNLRSFKFHGECAYNTILLNATLYNWKTMAKEMSVRTFCYPDSVIRKHMHDTHKLMEMLGAPLVTFLAFQELQVNALSVIKKAQEKLLPPNSEPSSSRDYRAATLPSRGTGF
ncbi:hypothetical protein FQN57_004183 [Myotisia sp. PD_48]|nr:hypothetical protein FQN57_004183 [Myotisia sp. PD_48]